MRHIDFACGELIPIGSNPPMVIGYNAAAPGVYNAFDPTTLMCREHCFADSLKIDFASPSPMLDTDGVTRLGATPSEPPSLFLPRSLLAAPFSARCTFLPTLSGPSETPSLSGTAF